MLSTVKKDKNRRILVKKFEIKKLYAKVFQQDLLLKSVLEKSSTVVSLSSDYFRKISKDSKIDKQKLPLENFLYEKAVEAIPRNSSKNRVQNRCIKSGRSRAVLKFCKLSRICLRDEASKGGIPGMYKASW